MAEQVATLFVRLAQLAAAEGATPEDGSGIDGVWTTTLPARNRDPNWTVAMNCDTETEHTVTDVPREGDTISIRPGSATIWLGATPAGVCTPFDGTLVIQETLEGPSSIEDELLADIEAQLPAIDGECTTPSTGGGQP